MVDDEREMPHGPRWRNLEYLFFNIENAHSNRVGFCVSSAHRQHKKRYFARIYLLEKPTQRELSEAKWIKFQASSPSVSYRLDTLSQRWWKENIWKLKPILWYFPIALAMQQRSTAHKLSVPFTSDNDMDRKKLRAAASTTMSEIFETLECRSGGGRRKP